MRKVSRETQSPEIGVPIKDHPDLIEVAVSNPYAPSLTLYRLNADVLRWLDANCDGQYRVKPGNTFVRVTFSDQRDATLFWTFYG